MGIIEFLTTLRQHITIYCKIFYVMMIARHAKKHILCFCVATFTMCCACSSCCLEHTHTKEELDNTCILTVNIVSRGIRLYQGDFRREVHNWPSKQHSYLGFCSANGNTDGPRINIPVYAAVFNYYRAVYYTNTETFETTPADLDDYKNHHDLYGYIEMMIIVI